MSTEAGESSSKNLMATSFGALNVAAFLGKLGIPSPKLCTQPPLELSLLQLEDQRRAR